MESLGEQSASFRGRYQETLHRESPREALHLLVTSDTNCLRTCEVGLSRVVENEPTPLWMIHRRGPSPQHAACTDLKSCLEMLPVKSMRKICT